MMVIWQVEEAAIAPAVTAAAACAAGRRSQDPLDAAAASPCLPPVDLCFCEQGAAA